MNEFIIHTNKVLIKSTCMHKNDYKKVSTNLKTVKKSNKFIKYGLQIK